MIYLLLLLITCLSSIAHSMETNTTPQSEKTTHADIVKKIQEIDLDANIYQRYLVRQEMHNTHTLTHSKDMPHEFKNKKLIFYDNENASLHIEGTDGSNEKVSLGTLISSTPYSTGSTAYSPDGQSLVIGGIEWRCAIGCHLDLRTYYLHKNGQTHKLFTLSKFGTERDLLNFVTNSIFYLCHDNKLLLYNLDTHKLTSIPLPSAFPTYILSEGNGTLLLHGNRLCDGIFIGTTTVNNDNGDDIVFRRLPTNCMHERMKSDEITKIYPNMHNNQLFLMTPLKNDSSIYNGLFSYNFDTSTIQFWNHDKIECVTDHFIIKRIWLGDMQHIPGTIHYQIINKNTRNSFYSIRQQKRDNDGIDQRGAYTYHDTKPWLITPLLNTHLEKTAEFFTHIPSMEIIALLRLIHNNAISSTINLDDNEYNMCRQLPAAVQAVLGIHDPIFFAYCVLQRSALLQDVIRTIMHTLLTLHAAHKQKK